MFSVVASPRLRADFISISCWNVSCANQPSLIVRVVPASAKRKPVSAPPRCPANVSLSTRIWSLTCVSETHPFCGLLPAATTWNQTGIVAVNDALTFGSAPFGMLLSGTMRSVLRSRSRSFVARAVELAVQVGRALKSSAPSTQNRPDAAASADRAAPGEMNTPATAAAASTVTAATIRRVRLLPAFKDPSIDPPLFVCDEAARG
jgi:hypothetical protein